MAEKRDILLVEDSATQALRLQLILEQEAYHVQVVENGADALKVLEDTPFSIVITDWVMPEMDGLSLCRAIRDLRRVSYTYIILLTTKDTIVDIVAGLGAGADDYLVKPVHTAELFARLNAADRILNLEAELRTKTEEIVRLSIMDPLTGTFNRRYLADQLPGALVGSARNNRPLSLVLADIDHFKKVNDTFGHLAGDAVLKTFSQCLLSSVRQGLDWVVRFGGEEFIIVLPGCDLTEGQQAAERYRQIVRSAETNFDGDALKVTASFGVASIHPQAGDSNATMTLLLDSADSHLYKAKREGRDRCLGAWVS